MNKNELMKNIKYKLQFISDEKYVKLYYRLKFGKKLNIDSPKTFNEKLQWLKFNDRDPMYSIAVDKYAVRKFISNNNYGNLLIPIYGVFKKFDDIDFEKLPKQFVLKCNHDSGDIAICFDKDKFDIRKAKKTICKSLGRNYYNIGREWQYKNIKPLIICEKFIGENNIPPMDYKISCFNGKPDNVMVCLDREKGSPKYYFFDRNWELLPYNNLSKNATNDFKNLKPNNLDEMFDIAEKLSKPYYFSRIDLYNVNGKIYFGEITLCPDSGFDSNLLEEVDLKFGKKLLLPLIDY